MRCPGSVTLEAAIPDQSSPYAAEGTAAHQVASTRLETGEILPVGAIVEVDGYTVAVDEDMLAHTADYAKLVLQYAEGGMLLVEQRVDFSPVIGVPDSFGTADAVVIKGDTLVIIDLKYGMGVRVDAEDNEQLQLYALGALSDYGMLADFKEVVMVIHQPRLNHVSEWAVSVADLQAFGRSAADAAEWANTVAQTCATAEDLFPGEKQCRFCKAKATCPAMREEVRLATADVATADDFRDLSTTPSDTLAAAMDRVGLVEDWCKAIRAEVERRLFDGQPVEGYKLVEGRRGNRAWVSEADAEALFKSFRLKQDEMYNLKLISPTQAEKVIKDKSPKRWAKVEGLISRSEGKPSVAPVTDKRPALAITSVADDFRDRDE